MTATENIVFIDEVEDQVARLVLDEQVFHLPRALLPKDAREGQWLRISVAVTPARQRQRGPAQAFGESDPGGDIKL